MSFTFEYFKNKKNIDRFIPITAIDPSDTSILFATLVSIAGSGYKVYFDDLSGSLAIKDSQSEKKIINTLTKREPDISTSFALSNNPETNYFFSKPHGKWVLVILSNTYSDIRYNPIPRPDAADTYKNNNYEKSESVFASLIDYCYEENGKDPICRCLNSQQVKPSDRDTEFCMTDLFAGNKNLRQKVSFSQDNKQVYGAMSKDCHCMNQLCNPNHPFEIAYEDKPSNSCPDTRNYTICNANVIADRNSGIDITGGLTVEQQCANQDYGIPVDPVEEPKSNNNPIIITTGISLSILLVIIIVILFKKK